jgi:hypothetical protein
MDFTWLIEKWQEVQDESDDWTEKNLAKEFVDDLKEIARAQKVYG